MNKIMWVLVGGMLLSSTQAEALSCEVTYKAKKINKDSYLFTNVPSPEYKVGKVKSNGGTLKQCKANALQPLKDNKWKIIHAVGKKL